MADDPSQGEVPVTPTEPPAGEPDASDELSLPNPLVLAAIGLALLAIITFLPTLRGEGTWLDDVSLTDNPFVQATDGVARFWTSTDRVGRYQPMTLTSFWLGYRLFHEQPQNLLPTHLVNVLLHAIVVILIWTLLRRLEVPGAWFAAAVFAVHPVHTQAIAWISGRSVVLASMFYLSALLVYLRFLGLTPAAEVKTLLTLPPEPERLWGLAFVLFLCGIASNAAATIMFPFAVLLIIWWKRASVTAKEWLGLIPFFVAAIAGGAWVGWLQEHSLATKAIVSAFGPLSVADRLHIGFRAVWFYAAKVVFPYPLIFDYPRWTNVMDPGALCGFALLIVLFVLWFMRARLGRAPLVAAALFVLAILPMLNLLDPPAIRYSFVADNRQYLASAALIALIASLAVQWVTSEKWRDKLNPSYCAGIALAVLAIVSFHQGTFYLNNESLWKQTLVDNQSSVLAEENYADVLLGGDLSDPTKDVLGAAREWYKRAQAKVPNDPRAAVGLGTVAGIQSYNDDKYGHHDLATTQQANAQQYFRDAIRLDPDYKPAYVALALTLNNDQSAQIDALEQAVRIEPESLRTRLQLGSALLQAGKLDDAEKTLTDLIDDAPNASAAHAELGSVYIQKHDLQSALAEWQKAIQLDPTNTEVPMQFGRLLASSGELDLAAKQFLAVTLLDPSSVAAHVLLAHVYSKLGHRADAVTQLTQAIALNPDNAEVKAAFAAAEEDVKRHGPGTPASSQPATQSTTDPAVPGDGLNLTPEQKPHRQ